MNQKNTAKSELDAMQMDQRIIFVARKLFYDNGYKNTFLSHIATECGIKKQSLSYYFPSKIDLFNAVTNQIIEDQHEYIDRKFEELSVRLDDILLRTAIALKLLNYASFNDKKVERFYLDTFPDSTFPPNFNTYDFIQYEYIDEHYHLELNRSIGEIKMVARLIETSGNVLLYDYLLGLYDCTQDELQDYYISHVFRLMGIPQDLIDSINRESNDLIQRMNPVVLPYFNLG